MKKQSGVPGSLFCLKWYPPSAFRQVSWRQVFQTDYKICVIVSYLSLQRCFAVPCYISPLIFFTLMLWWDEERPFPRAKQNKALFQTERNNLLIQAAQMVQIFLFPSQMLLAIEVISDPAIFLWVLNNSILCFKKNIYWSTERKGPAMSSAAEPLNFFKTTGKILLQITFKSLFTKKFP